MDLEFKLGRLVAIFGITLSIFIYLFCGLMLLSVLPWVIMFYVWGGVGVGLFIYFFFLVCDKFLY